MKKIIKDQAPAFWTKFIRRHPTIRYDDLNATKEGRQLKADIRLHMIQNQQFLCAYCCKIIKADNSHNEHIKPRSLYPNLSMEYNNLLASCSTSNTCGMKKLSQYNSNFISPLREDCESHFQFEPNGRIIGITERGKYTVTLLNLNSFSLVDARSALYDECEMMAKQCGKEYILEYYIQPVDGHLPRFVDMVQFFYSNGFFDADDVVD